MISEHYDLSEFIGQLDRQDVADIILMAQDETTAAERFYLKSHGRQAGARRSRNYAEQLKLLITYLRYGVRASGLPKDSIEMLNARLPH